MAIEEYKMTYFRRGELTEKWHQSTMYAEMDTDTWEVVSAVDKYTDEPIEVKWNSKLSRWEGA